MYIFIFHFLSIFILTFTNEALAEDTKAVRDEMNELLAQYRREKENAETR